MNASPTLSRRSTAMKNVVRSITAVVLFLGAFSLRAPGASAHPLGNFTTNVSLGLDVSAKTVSGTYVVDFAEIPALQIRQKLGVTKGSVPVPIAKDWGDRECDDLSKNVTLDVGGRRASWSSVDALVNFPAGQAGLSTLRLECEWDANVSGTGSTLKLDVTDNNFTNRQGWREMFAVSEGVALTTTLPTSSPTNVLRNYPSGAIGAPSDVRSARINFRSGHGLFMKSPASPVLAQTKPVTRGNDGLTNRFQSLVARKTLSPVFAIGAALLAMLLGGFHALAPGHGKSMMAAYVIGQQGGRRKELATIGVTVAITHTIGVVALGIAALTSSSLSPDRTFKWAGVVSGLLVVFVGLGLLRDRLRTYRVVRGGVGLTPRQVLGTSEPHPHPPAHHDHPHNDHPHHGQNHDHPHHGRDHDQPHHDHPHHGHDHPHHRSTPRFKNPFQFRRARLDQARKDPKFVVTEHAHGGSVSHTHVLPAPGAKVSRRQLVSMGFAGGLVPSPSALVVLLAAVALERVWFGVVLVVAYGIGLAITLIGAGLALVYFEGRLKRWSAKSGRASSIATPLVSALPIASAFVLIGGGALLITRALAAL
jgi:nickel/cobalt transporter (NicO) family protein